MVKPWVAEFEKTLKNRAVVALFDQIDGDEVARNGAGYGRVLHLYRKARIDRQRARDGSRPGCAETSNSGVALGSKVKFTS